MPVKTGATAAITQRSMSSSATGTPGTSIPAAHAADTRSQTTRTRRAGKRSARDERRVPPRTYGSRPNAKVSALSSGEPVSR